MYLCVIFPHVVSEVVGFNPTPSGVGGWKFTLFRVNGPWMTYMGTWAACLSDGMPQRSTLCHAVYFNPVTLLSASAALEPPNDA